MTQPTALFLADILEDAGKPADIAEKCAAELRRLHTQRDALLKALQEAFNAFAFDDEGPVWADSTIAKARAAIKAAEENT